MHKQYISARISEGAYKVLKAYMGLHKCTKTDALESLIMGQPKQQFEKTVIKEVVKEVQKLVWIDCQFAKILCSKSDIVVLPETCWDCEKGLKFELNHTKSV